MFTIFLACPILHFRNNLIFELNVNSKVSLNAKYEILLFHSAMITIFKRQHLYDEKKCSDYFIFNFSV